eukprot:CAMPEP_0114350314 /NCGR_PEP_ID=MMETSP0101-20121206/16261_1 /TAXON_ID=38822 ORGANISM="Pteridomonas danica, Strain PT" /NCGR_SAMPLE_ID=MMETSP0101 /ASSEMBLY_ACC=CAM_ASM_000211 /LENGTH=635 /DNA_ID=CAMNT_0001489469 /DNA_START=135 /DNA_END=2039 /DNA_ORIENTATION=-
MNSLSLGGETVMKNLSLQTPSADISSSFRQSKTPSTFMARTLDSELDGEEEEDEDMFTFNLPPTPFTGQKQAPTSFPDTLPVNNSLLINEFELNDDDDDDDESLLNTLSSPEQSSAESSPVDDEKLSRQVNQFDPLINNIRIFLNSKDVQSKDITVDINKILEAVTNSDIIRVQTEQLSCRSNELLEVLVACIAKGFELAPESKDSIHVLPTIKNHEVLSVDEHLVGFAISTIKALQNVSSCSQQFHFNCLATLISTLVSALQKAKYMTEKGMNINSKIIELINRIILKAVQESEKSPIIIALIKLLTFNGHYNKENDYPTLSMYMKFLFMATQQNDQPTGEKGVFECVDLIKLAPELAKLCDGDSFHEDNVKKCVRNMLNGISIRSHGNGLFVLSLCMSLDMNITSDSLIYSELSDAQLRNNSISTQENKLQKDKDIEKKIGCYCGAFRYQRIEIMKETMEELRSLVLNLDDLKDWLQYYEIPDKISIMIKNAFLMNESVCDNGNLINQTETNQSPTTPITSKENKKTAADFLAKMRQQLNQENNVVNTPLSSSQLQKKKSALGDSTNRGKGNKEEVSLEDRIAALTKKTDTVRNTMNLGSRAAEEVTSQKPTILSPSKGIGSVAERLAALRAS